MKEAVLLELTKRPKNDAREENDNMEAVEDSPAGMAYASRRRGYREAKMENPTSTITWMPIKTRCDFRPDAGVEILIYDGYLDDVVLGTVDYPEDFEIGDDNSKVEWIDSQSGKKLRDPEFWSNVPFPVEQK